MCHLETQEKCTCAQCTTVEAKNRAPLRTCIYDIGRPSTHFWFSFQVDLIPKSRLNLTGGLVKDLRIP
jgi:hypothetical protein